MNEATATVQEILLGALSGKSAHVVAATALDGLDWQAAGCRPKDAPHSVFELVNHLVYWQDFALGWLGGDKPLTPPSTTPAAGPGR